MKKEINKDLMIWYGIGTRMLVVWGLVFFGNGITGDLDFMSAFVVAGLYFFVELAKQYGINPTQINKRTFLLLP